MANLLLVIDPDAERRARFIDRTAPLLSPFDGLRVERCASGNFTAVWARDPHAPISEHVDTEGAAIIWGDALRGDEPASVGAAALRTLWADPHTSAIFDGFHAAAVYDPQRGLRVGADLLGLFPIYYWSARGVVLVGSSPELFRHHPHFRMALSPAGLVGILLTSHLVDGQTLLDGVRRLDAGALLVCPADSLPREIAGYQLPLSRRYFDLSFAGHVDMLNAVLERATRRHAPPDHPHTLLLSGGLDSRMLGGYLAEHGNETMALTFGQSRDLEMTTARRVANELRFPHRTADVPVEDYPGCADLQARWEHLSNGFSTIRSWGVPPLLRSMPHRAVAGYLADVILGGPIPGYLAHGDGRGRAFDAVFGIYNRSGFHPATLEALLRPEIFAGLVEHTIDRLRRRYQSYSDLDEQRAWCFELHHRQRFQVGANVWRLTFGAWPVLPAVDREILDAVGGMPATTIDGRRAQTALVCRRFPSLAALPLDRNSYDTRPLLPRRGTAVSDYVLRQWARAVTRIPSAWRGERRVYYRVYDLDNRGWRGVRRVAEAQRRRVLPLFDGDALSALLPSPEAPVRLKDPIVDSSGTKLLLGLLVWSADHL